MGNAHDLDFGGQPATTGLNRREVLAAAGTLPLVLGAGTEARTKLDWPALVGMRDGFLSSRNPLATEGQRRVEDRALALLQRPEMQRARQIATTLWQNAVAWPLRDQGDLFAPMIDEYMFHHAFRAANGDPNHPEVARFMVPPHRWFGRDVPGSRWAGDSPDFIYRTIPIAHGGRYEIRGWQTSATPPIVFYSLMSDTTAAPQTLALLESLDMEFEANGSFLITVDETPANGRRNHMQTKPGADFIMIRDALGDWLTDSANALTVRRLNPDGGAKSEEAMARHAAKIAIEGVYYTFYITQNGNLLGPNQVTPPMSSAVFGGVATQWTTGARVELDQDEAIIVRSNGAGAGFRNAVLTNAFTITNEYWRRTSSLNMRQMAPDADGDFTCVIAHRDPGVYNWIDTAGLRRTRYGHRWQGFTRGGAKSDPWITFKLVKLDRLEQELEGGVKRVDAAARKQQLADREAGFGRRFVDS